VDVTESPDFTWLFLKMMAGLVLVLVLAVVLALIRNALGTQQIPPNPVVTGLAIINRYPVGRSSHLLLVKVAARYLLLGASESSVNLVTELSKEEGEGLEK
jgi:flagellar biogenesis protein FliO